MAGDDVVFTASGKVPAGTRVSAEEVTSLNGGAVTAQKLERIILSLRTADATAVDVTSVAPLPVTDPLVAAALAALLVAVDGLEGFTDGIEGALASILAKQIAAPSTEAKQDTANTALAAINANTDTLEAVLAHGTYGYLSGTTGTTVDVPAGARVKRVSVVASSAGTATVTIAGGSTITIPASAGFDEQIPGDGTLGGDVVIGGNVASFYVAWTT